MPFLFLPGDLSPRLEPTEAVPAEGLLGVLRDDRRESIVPVLEVLRDRERDVTREREVLFVEAELRREAVLPLFERDRDAEREPLLPFFRFLCFLLFLSLLRPLVGTAPAE